MPEKQLRRAGLSRNVRVEPLLHSIFHAENQRKRRITEPEDPNAPPVSDSSSGSDDDETTSRRGDIRRTTFQTNPSTDAERKATYGTRKSARTASQSAKPQSQKRLRDSEDEGPEPVKKAKAAGRRDDGLGSHFRSDVLRRKTLGPKISYGTQNKSGSGRSAQASIKSMGIHEDLSSPERLQPKFKPVESLDDFSSPETPKSKLVLPDGEDLPFESSPQKAYKALSKACDDLDTPSPVKQFKPTSVTDEVFWFSTQEEPTGKTAGSNNSSDELMRKARLLRQKKKADKEAKLRRQQGMEADSPKIQFKPPAGLDSQDDLAYDSDLDIPDGAQVEDFRPVHDILPDDSVPVCPMCREPVEQALLDKFSKKKITSITQQQQFCNAHKTKTAREAWIDRGYPDIDWSRLDERIAEHHQFLEDILNGGTSHFGTLFAKSVKSGKNKTLLKTDQNMTPGYYGSRGARIMNENLIDRFSGLLRKVAVRDRLVSARGHTAFVQFVLVPELAVRLIMQDMDVSAERARAIMVDSQKVGNLLNEEEDDVIVDDQEDRSDSRSSFLSSLEDGVSPEDMS